MAKHSAGLLLYRKGDKGYEVLLIHPGGPFWAKKDAGSWSMPKGEYDPMEQPLIAAKREFSEEIGQPAPEGNYLDLGEVKQPSGKLIQAFALETDVDLAKFESNTFEMEWPPKSGQQQSFPEADRAEWFTLGKAGRKLLKGQLPFLETLTKQLGASPADELADSPQVSLFD